MKWDSPEPRRSRGDPARTTLPPGARRQRLPLAGPSPTTEGIPSRGATTYPDASSARWEEDAARGGSDSAVIPVITLPALPTRESVRRRATQRTAAASLRVASWGPPVTSWPSNDEEAAAGADDAPQADFVADGAHDLPDTGPRLPDRTAARPRGLSRMLIPGRPWTRHVERRLALLTGEAETSAAWRKQGLVVARALARRRGLLGLMALVLMATTILVNTAGSGTSATWTVTAWRVLSGAGPAPTPMPPPAPDSTAAGHYVAKYGFDWPRNPQPIPSGEFQRLATMLPYAYKATAMFDRRYGASIEPQLVVWWTHAEGIGARINFSNCANYGTRPGTNYFTDIENCPHASFWQLGYGNQFSMIYVLKNAFTDLYGNPNDTQVVQRVGQAVLNYDQQQGTVPPCGGYACTFPALTIDQIMAGVNETTGVVTADNWWASVLSRDPAINSYMIAQALTFFSHAATANWVGCYYAEPCWGNESDRLGDILSAWPALRAAAGL